MSWKGWETFNPNAPRASVCRASFSRSPRVKNAVPTEVEGILFASQHEAERYLALRLDEQAGTVTDLRRQFAFPLMVNGLVIGHYRADFVYARDGHPVVEDAKGWRTEMYRWKRRHFEAQYGIRIQET